MAPCIIYMACNTNCKLYKLSHSVYDKIFEIPLNGELSTLRAHFIRFEWMIIRN